MISKKQGYIYLFLTFVLWGSLYVVSKYTLGKLPPFTISFVRFVIAFLTLCVLQGKTKKKMDRRDYKYVLLIGGAGYFIAVGAQLLGTKYAGASIASLINSLNPVTMTLFAMFLLGEAVTFGKIAGIFLALSGVYVILGSGGEGAGMNGILLSLFSVVLWSVVSVMSRKVTQNYEPLQITRNSAGVAAMLYLPVCLWEVQAEGGLHPDFSCVAALAYMGILCTGLAYLLWNKSLSALEAGTCSAFYPIQPLVSAGLGIIFLGEKIRMTFWTGAVLIVAGVLVNLLSGSRKKAVEDYTP